MRSLLRNIALATLSLSLGVAGAPKPKNESEPSLVKRADPQAQGCDVSDLQGGITPWAELKSKGFQFAYIQLTIGAVFINPFFDEDSNIAAMVGFITGAYHVARLEASRGADQAQYFLNNGGKGVPGDLPGAVYLQGICAIGWTAAQTVSWIQDFSDTYQSETGRYPVIYTSTGYWVECTGNSTAFSSTNPLWIVSLGSSISTLTLPGNWSVATFWKDAAFIPPIGPVGQDSYNGNITELTMFAEGA